MKKVNGNHVLLLLSVIFFVTACGKKDTVVTPPVDPTPVPLSNTVVKLDNNSVAASSLTYNIKTTATIRLSFNNALDKATVTAAVSLTENGTVTVPVNFTYENNDSTLVITASAALKNLTRYNVYASTVLQSVKKGKLNTDLNFQFITQIDSTDKFPLISDNALLDTIQKRTFKYFWDYGHPVSGLARERSNATPETVTSGGTGFGIMAIPVAVSRNFITRAEAVVRMQKIVSFLKNTAQKFHGAFPHWLNGTTGTVIPFSTKDDGADLVETSYLMAGLLTARQYFNGPAADETTLRADINTLWNAVEWSWFRQGTNNVLYWHWSPNYNWDMNVKIQGWNECLITYILAASSTTFGIPQAVYKEGFARSGAMVNGATYYGYQLPLGSANGGPLFFAHYSFLGINPNGLNDTYANYQTQVTNHTKINYEYCKANPNGFFGYSNLCWGLTASDVPNGYNASSPNNDIGVISPTAALSSFAYTPAESMNALKFFYYKLGDKIFKEYGFVDAFSLKDLWYAGSFLAIDQGPIIIMLENYRSQLIWNLLTSCPEVKNGMKNVLGFTAPYL
ncbi:glucoamylase family protein [Ferruginibacter sp. SUN106]|uniref:glucoamylase family protein n=1 Tax=Ferruginibacter sp. SUN106 TaxID=2978348 RepID=UPI003D363ADB